MHIVYFSPRYYPAAGGAENHLAALAERFVQDGHQVTVVTTDAHDFQLFWFPDKKRVAAEAVTSHNGVNIVRFPVRHLPFVPLAYHAWRRGLWLLSRLPLPFLTGVMARLSRRTPYVPELWRWVDEVELTADVVIGMNICYEPFLWAGQRLARRLGVPFVAQPLTHLGAGDVAGQDEMSGFYTMRHQKAVVLEADRAIVQTETERDFYRDRGLAPENMVISGPAIDLAEMNGDASSFKEKYQIEAPLVGYIGTHDFNKGTVHLIEAARLLWARGVVFELGLAGVQTADFAHYWEQLPLNIQDRIHLLGRLDEQDKQNFLAAMQLFVMTSRIDSFGIVFLEAWFHDTPVIGSTAWGMSDVISDGEDGVLVPFGDVAQLANVIEHLITDHEEAIRLAANGHEKTIAYHDWSHKYQLVRQMVEGV